MLVKCMLAVMGEEVPDKGGNPQAVCNHGHGIPLGHPILSVKEVTRPVTRPDQQCGSMEVSFKCKLTPTETLVVHLPQHGCAVLLIEHITCVNKEKHLVLLLGVLLPQRPHRANPPLDPGFQSPIELLRPAGLLELLPHHRQHTLHEHLSPGLSH